MPTSARVTRRGAVLGLVAAALFPLVAGAAERIEDRGDPAALADAARGAVAALDRRVARTDDARAAAPARERARTLRSLLDVLGARSRPPHAATGDAGDTASPGDPTGAGAALARALDARFRLGAPGRVFVTGYHEPLLEARRTRDARFRFPLYGPPPARPGGGESRAGGEGGDALPTRAEIERGALAGRGLELFWVDDPIELFFLHVQGSGQVQLEDGARVRVGFAGTNDRPYTSIGSLLVARGAFARPEDATAPALKAWLRDHPDEAPAILESNQRFVFFRELDGASREGPPGALGAPLVAYRSVAVDPKATPFGSVGLLRIELPDGRSLAQLVIAMDAGAAIRGPGRIDLFVGSDRSAAEVAGLLRATGSIAWLEARLVR